MALPTDFWRNEQMLNIFRTKPCQRLAREGVCEWRSQCQFSHSLDWPRRPPQKHRYSPELCPHIRIVPSTGGSEVRIENRCSAGVRCSKSHSKEEVLYHPQLFKTCVCEEHRGHSNTPKRGNARSKCHRYYCPFAHGQQEMRSSQLPLEQREQYYYALEIFPMDDCCRVCAPHRISLMVSGGDGCALMGNDGQDALSYSAQGGGDTPQCAQLVAFPQWGTGNELSNYNNVGIVGGNTSASVVTSGGSPPQIAHVAAMPQPSPNGPMQFMQMQVMAVPVGGAGGCVNAASCSGLQMMQISPCRTPPPLGYSNIPVAWPQVPQSSGQADMGLPPVPPFPVQTHHQFALHAQPHAQRMQPQHQQLQQQQQQQQQQQYMTMWHAASRSGGGADSNTGSPSGQEPITPQKSASGGKRRSHKLMGNSSGLLRNAERIVEASDPPVMPEAELRKMLEDSIGGSGEHITPLGRLHQHMKALPERFLIIGQKVTLTKFAHLPEVRHAMQEEHSNANGNPST